jgi:hypothetical protein
MTHLVGAKQGESLVEAVKSRSRAMFGLAAGSFTGKRVDDCGREVCVRAE